MMVLDIHIPHIGGLEVLRSLAAGNSSDTAMTNSDNQNAESISYPMVSGAVFGSPLIYKE